VTQPNSEICRHAVQDILRCWLGSCWRRDVGGTPDGTSALKTSVPAYVPSPQTRTTRKLCLHLTGSARFCSSCGVLTSFQIRSPLNERRSSFQPFCMVLLLYHFRPPVQASAYLQLLLSNTRLSLLRVTVSLSLWEIRRKNYDIPSLQHWVQSEIIDLPYDPYPFDFPYCM
jgi:hypothetical protein